MPLPCGSGVCRMPPISSYLSHPNAEPRAMFCRPARHMPGALAWEGRLLGGGTDFPAVVRVCARLIVRLRLRVNRHVHGGNVNQAGGGSRTLRSVLMSLVLPDR